MKWIDLMFGKLSVSKYTTLLNKYGSGYGLKICEELGELQTAYLHYLSGKVSEDDVIEEVADVIIQIEKIVAHIVLIQNEDTKTFLLKEKFHRILERKRLHLDKIINS